MTFRVKTGICQVICANIGHIMQNAGMKRRKFPQGRKFNQSFMEI